MITMHLAGLPVRAPGSQDPGEVTLTFRTPGDDVVVDLTPYLAQAEENAVIAADMPDSLSSEEETSRFLSVMTQGYSLEHQQ